MAVTVEARVKQKKDTEANWLVNPLVILDGEQAFVVNDSGFVTNFKIGNGSDIFADLPYFWAGGKLNVKQFGAVGNGVHNDTTAFQNCFGAANLLNSGVEIPSASVKYILTAPITISSTVTGQVGISIEGTGSAGASLIEYSGTGYAFNFLGSGAEGDTPLTRFQISNIRINGGANNTVSDGGLNFKRVYIVQVQNVFSTGWRKSTAISVSVRNCFNFKWDGGQIANGFPGPAGSHSLEIGSENTSAWNSSNVEFKNILIQYSGGNGVNIKQDANIFDNITFNNISFGKNAGWSIYGITSPGTSALVNNISIENCHFESPGYNLTSLTPPVTNPNPISGTGHIFLTKCTGLRIQNNSFQDALTYISLDSVLNFHAGGGNKFFETGFYTLTGNTLLKLATTTANCIGTFDENTIRTDQIDNLYNFTESGGFRIQLSRNFRTKAIESTWNGDIFPNPANYQGTLVDRYQSTNQPFDQMVTNGTNWYRVMVSSKYKGERSTIPSTTEGAGSWYSFITPSVHGTTGSSYMLFGWISPGGGVWKEMRMPLDNPVAAINTTTTALSASTLNSTYPISDLDNNILKYVYAPNIVAGAQVYVRVTSTNWLVLAAILI